MTDIRSVGRSQINELLPIIEYIKKNNEINAAFNWPSEVFVSEVWNSSGWALYLKNQPICFLFYRELSVVYEISVLVTHPEYRHNGYMKTLLKYFMQIKPAHFSIWLEVHEKNQPAISLYENLGFVRSGFRPRYYQDGAAAILYTYQKPSV